LNPHLRARKVATHPVCHSGAGRAMKKRNDELPTKTDQSQCPANGQLVILSLSCSVTGYAVSVGQALTVIAS